MVRPLTGNTITEKNATRTAPINIIRIDFGGALGTKYYSDHALGSGDASSVLNAAQRIVSWGALAFASPSGNAFVTSDTTTSLVFRDSDKIIFGYFLDTAFQNKKVIVYQYFSGLGAGDVQAIIEGVISEPPVWNEANATMRVNLADLSYQYRTNIGTIVRKEDLPYVDPTRRSQTIPLVFGNVKRAPCLGIHDALVTHLVRDCHIEDTVLYVDNAENFPQETTIVLRVGLGGVIQGYFLGNTFHITKRDWTILSSTISENEAGVSDFEFRDWGLGETDDVYRGYWIKVLMTGYNYDAGGNPVYRRILEYQADSKTLIYRQQGVDIYRDLVATDPYDIVTMAIKHDEGTLVFMAVGYKFIVSDAPCADVPVVETFGSIDVTEPDEASDDETDPVVDYEGWLRVNPDSYIVNKYDVDVFGVDHPITTLTFPRNIREFQPEFDGVFANVAGVDTTANGAGSVITDPAEIIKTILTRFVGVPAEYIDSDSFTTASAEGTSFIPFGFVLSRVWDSIELCANLAFQARCMMLWEAGKARLLWLKDAMAAPSLTISKDAIIQNTLKISRTAFGNVVSEVEGVFYPKGEHNRDGERRSLVATDAATEAAYGRHVTSIELWAHTDNHHASMITSFWLTRWKWIWEQVEFSTFLTSLELERQDVVQLDWATFFLNGQLGRVLDVTHTPGSVDSMDTLRLKLELPIGPGCATICEVSCEGGVETGCLTSCESVEETCWQCETSCEYACQLFCTSNSQTGCQVSECGEGCGAGCEATGCDNVGCMTSCQENCDLLPTAETGLPCEIVGYQTDCNGWETAECEIAGAQTDCNGWESVPCTAQGPQTACNGWESVPCTTEGPQTACNGWESVPCTAVGAETACNGNWESVPCTAVGPQTACNGWETWACDLVGHQTACNGNWESSPCTGQGPQTACNGWETEPCDLIGLQTACDGSWQSAGCSPTTTETAYCNGWETGYYCDGWETVSCGSCETSCETGDEGDLPGGTDCCWGYYCREDVGATFNESCQARDPFCAGEEGCNYRRLVEECTGFGEADDNCPNAGASENFICYVLTEDVDCMPS